MNCTGFRDSAIFTSSTPGKSPHCTDCNSNHWFTVFVKYLAADHARKAEFENEFGSPLTLPKREHCARVARLLLPQFLADVSVSGHDQFVLTRRYILK
jgi:hypothetical protein